MIERFTNWIRTEPARARIYSAFIPICALLVARGVMTGNDVAFIMAILAALLGVTATETTRSKVVPLAKLEMDADGVYRPALSDPAHGHHRAP